MAKFTKKGEEPERLPTAEEIQAGVAAHPNRVPLIAPAGVTAASGCELEGRLCWAHPDVAEQLVAMHGFVRPT